MQDEPFQFVYYVYQNILLYIDTLYDKSALYLSSYSFSINFLYN